MAYLQAAFSPLFRLKINERQRQFTVRSALATWSVPDEGAIFGNHKSVTVFRQHATELEFYGRLGHKHAIALVRESDRNVMGVIDVDDAGLVSMRHTRTPTVRMNAAVQEFENIALMVGFPHEKFTMCIVDVRNEDTDLIRYRPAEAKFYIPAQYLVPRTRVNMSQRQNTASSNQASGSQRTDANASPPDEDATGQSNAQPSTAGTDASSEMPPLHRINPEPSANGSARQ